MWQFCLFSEDHNSEDETAKIFLSFCNIFLLSEMALRFLPFWFQIHEKIIFPLKYILSISNF